MDILRRYFCDRKSYLLHFENIVTENKACSFTISLSSKYSSDDAALTPTILSHISNNSKRLVWYHHFSETHPFYSISKTISNETQLIFLFFMKFVKQKLWSSYPAEAMGVLHLFTVQVENTKTKILRCFIYTTYTPMIKEFETIISIYNKYPEYST